MSRKLFAIALLMHLFRPALMTAGQAGQALNLMPGSAAPALALEKILQAPSGAKTDWESLRGKVVVLEFWATWCAPCIALQPHLNALAEKFKDQPVYFISVSDEPEEIVTPFLSRRPLKGWVGLDPKHVTVKAYGVYAIPKTFVIDQRGKIVTSMSSVAEGEKLSEDLLNQLLKSNAAATATNRPKEQPAAPEIKTRASSNQPLIAKSSGQPTTSGKTKAIEDEPLLDISIRFSRAAEGTTARISSVPLGFSAQGAKLEFILGDLLMANHLSFPGTRMSIPAELREKRFDIIATLQPELQSDKMGFNRPLIVSALESALGIKISRVTHEADVFVLTAPKELNGSLRPTKATGGHSSADEGVLAASSMELSSLVAAIEKKLNVPVVDETGLRGKFDWDLVWDAKNPQSFLEAIRKQFGLELAPAKRQVEMVIVEKSRVD